VIRYGGIEYSSYSNPYNTRMVWLSGSSAAQQEVRDCVVEYSYGSGIYADSNQTPWVHDNVIRNCATGVQLAGGGLVEDNTINQTGGTGISMSGSGTLQGNTLTGSGSGTGVSLASGSGTVRDNTVSGFSTALSMTGGSPTIQNNNITGNSTPIYQGGAAPVYSGNTIGAFTNRVIAVGGTLGQNTTWSASPPVSGAVYLITSDFTIPAGRTLTIEPGVVVKFQAIDFNTGSSTDRYRLRMFVDGTLNLLGTAAQKVVFTSSRDDTYGGDVDGDATAPAAGNWGYIKYSNPANTLHDAVIRYGGIEYSSYSNPYNTRMVWITAPNVSVRRCDFQYAYGTGVYISVGTSVADPRMGIIGCMFDYCPTGIDYTGAPTVNSAANFVGNYFSHGTTAIYVRNVGTTLQAIYNQFVGITSYGIQNTDTARTVSGQNNWWGDASGPSGQGPGSGVPVSQYVNYSNWLTTPSSTAQGVFNVLAQRRSGSMLVDIYYDLLGTGGT
jgi:parallel beta-helix repeat protein